MTIFDSGVTLMLYGMGTVFVFLTILIATTMTMSWCISRFSPQLEVASEENPKMKSLTGSTQMDSKLLAVLQASVDAHRKV